ncbi:MAG: efflux RND transporter periplasmic adaptor subunit [Mariniblastus sp.]
MIHQISMRKSNSTARMFGFKIVLTMAVLLLGTTLNAQSPSELTAKVKKGDLKIDVEVTGEFVADDKDEIRMEPSKYKGDLIITKILAEGTPVKKDEVLMEFEPDKLDEALKEAKDEVTDEQVAVNKATAELESAKIDAESKQSQLKKELSFLEKEVAAAIEKQALELAKKEKEIADSESSLADARVDHKQLTELYQERELHTKTENMLIERSKKKLEDSAKNIEEKRSEFKYFKQFELLKTQEEKQLDVEKKKAEIKKEKITLEAAVAEKQAVVDKAQRKLDTANKKVEGLEKDKTELQVVAPRDGILFYGALGGDSSPFAFSMGGGNDEMEVGGRVKTHTILLTVATMDNLTVKMQVKENDVQHMKKDLAITVRPDAFPSLQLEGKLTKVDQIASRTDVFSNARRFTVRGKCTDTAKQLKTGMNCRVVVHADMIPDAIQVPIVAVAEEGGKYYCNVKTTTGFEKREVKIGLSNAENVQIKEGLRTGEVVYLNDPEDS